MKNTDFSRFNVNYFNNIGKCFLSVEISNIPLMEDDVFSYEVMYAINNHYAFKEHASGAFYARPLNRMSALVHFANMMNLEDLNYHPDIANIAKQMGVDKIYTGYIACAEIYNKLYDDAESKFNNVHRYILPKQIYYEDKTMFAKYYTKINAPDEFGIFTSNVKPFNFDCVNFKFNTQDSQIKESLKMNVRSLDIHYHYGIAFLNMYTEENKPDEYIEIGDNSRRFIGFISKEGQKTPYSSFDLHDVHPYYSGRAIPMKESLDTLDLERTVCLYSDQNKPIKFRNRFFKISNSNYADSKIDLWQKIKKNEQI